MRWILRENAPRGRARSIRRALLRTAFDQAGGASGLYRLGVMLLESDDAPAAVQAFELSRRSDPQGFSGWQALAHAYLRSDRPEDALAACDVATPAPGLTWIRGRTLEALGRFDDAAAAFRTALDEPGDQFKVAEAWLRMLAQRNRPADLLTAIEALPVRLRGSAAALAYRAIALSQGGRADEAAALVDLDRHVARVRFTPPASLGSLADCNATLAQGILQHEAASRRGPGFSICHNPPPGDDAVVTALHDFIRDALVQFVREMPVRGLTQVMPSPPDTAWLYVANLVLSEGGHNGEHIHARGYLSAVYYVAVPPEIETADDDRGALLIGAAESVAGGHRPCWGVRALKPEAGMLVIMPSHVFHDVAPSLAVAPRISIAVDMVAQAG